MSEPEKKDRYVHDKKKEHILVTIVIIFSILALTLAIFSITGVWAQEKELADTWAKTLAIPAAIAAIYRLVLSIIDRYHANKKADFLNIRSKQNKNRTNSTQECYEAYINKYSSKKEDVLAPSTALIIKKEWEPYFNDKNALKDKDGHIRGYDKEKIKLIPIEEIDKTSQYLEETPSEEMCEDRSLHTMLQELNLLPMKKLTYAEHLCEYGDKPPFNGENVAVSKIELNEHGIPHFHLYRAHYFDFLNTCQGLEYAYESGYREAKLALDVLDLNNRTAGIGISDLTVINHVKKYNDSDSNQYTSLFLMHKRSNNLLESPGKVHVVPAGSMRWGYSLDEHNYGQLNKEKTSKMIDNIFKEFDEEIITEEYEKEVQSTRYIEEHNQALHAASSVYYLGCGIEPYNTKMEILTVIVIDADKLDDHIKAALHLDSFESAEKYYKERKDTSEGKIVVEEFTKATLEEYAMNPKITPAGKEILTRAHFFYDQIKHLN